MRDESRDDDLVGEDEIAISQVGPPGGEYERRCLRCPSTLLLKMATERNRIVPV
jgi:hypothetical protein